MLPRRHVGEDTIIVIPAQAGIEGPRASRPRHVNSRAFAVEFLNREYARMDANVFPKSNPSSKPDRAAPCCSSLDSRLRGNDVRVAKLEVLKHRVGEGHLVATHLSVSGAQVPVHMHSAELVWRKRAKLAKSLASFFGPSGLERALATRPLARRANSATGIAWTLAPQ